MPKIETFLETVHPYDGLPKAVFADVVTRLLRYDLPAGSTIFHAGERLAGLYMIEKGRVEIRSPSGEVISQLSRRDHFGERGLSAEGKAFSDAVVLEDAVLYLLPAENFYRLIEDEPVFARFFSRRGTLATPARPADMSTRKVADLMSKPPVICAPDDTVRRAAEIIRDRKVSCLGVVDGERFVGIVTVRDLAARVVAAGLDPEKTTAAAIMTRDPVGLSENDLGSDVLHLMMERGIGHLPVVDGTRLVGMITQTDLTRFQAVTSALLIRDIAAAKEISALKAATAAIPNLLVQLIGGHNPHEVVTRLITDIADAVTRRLIAFAEEKLGAPPVPYLWLACGSQGRQEQTGTSDQDNCLILDNSYDAALHGAWFEGLARFVCDGLNECGYVYCPGDMMATNPRWRQPASVWRQYFIDWIMKPDPTAQMLASVMFDLRPIFGAEALFREVQAETLGLAANSPFFVAHMVGNSLKHAPPLGLLRGFATLKSGEHRHQIDMKMNGVVPVVDLARVYALLKQLTPANTRARLLAAAEAELITESEARDLIAAYDLIAEDRLRNQAAQVKAGHRPDNYLSPYDMGEFERSQLRDAFVVVRTMQAGLAHRGALPI